MGDLLLASDTQDCNKGTKALLQLLTDWGYRVSGKKAENCQRQIQYLGFPLTQGKSELGPDRKRVIIFLPWPWTKKVVQEFLRAAGFCHIWIPRFSAIAKPLYDLVGGPDRKPPAWTEEAEAAFTEMKSALGQAPALALPDREKPFKSLCT